MDFSFDQQDTSDDGLTKIIENGNRLEIGYIPEEIRHREKEAQTLRDRFFNPIFTENMSKGALLVGPPGSGKTATAQWVKQGVESSNDTERVDIAFVNCENRPSSREVYRSVMNQVGINFERSTETSKNVQYLLETLNGDAENPRSKHLVVILDEIDALNRTSYINDILYTLTYPSGAYDRGDWEETDSRISVIAISNDEKVTKYFSSSVNSRFQRMDINFYTYTVDQITDILNSRQEKAFRTEILGKKALTILAKEIQDKFDSDVRFGINVLKSIPDQLNRKQGVDLTEENQIELVEDAIQEVQRSQIEQAIRENGDHFLILLSALVQQLEEDDTKRGDINDAYRQACEYAALDKEGGGNRKQMKSMTYVYNKLEEDLVSRNIVEKEKRYDLEQNPFCYTSLVDFDLFQETVMNILEKKGLAKKIIEGRHRQKQAAMEESKENIQRHMPNETSVQD